MHSRQKRWPQRVRTGSWARAKQSAHVGAGAAREAFDGGRAVVGRLTGLAASRGAAAAASCSTSSHMAVWFSSKTFIADSTRALSHSDNSRCCTQRPGPLRGHEEAVIAPPPPNRSEMSSSGEGRAAAGRAAALMPRWAASSKTLGGSAKSDGMAACIALGRASEFNRPACRSTTLRLHAGTSLLPVSPPLPSPTCGAASARDLPWPGGSRPVNGDMRRCDESCAPPRACAVRPASPRAPPSTAASLRAPALLGAPPGCPPRAVDA
mmetsp:Transcript_115616/g.332010  ORF Transcript_115616/g.332010 Transcript_115616/m.332010 type:complete len:266 (+) Transcript_115616:445-1242(+)